MDMIPKVSVHDIRRERHSAAKHVGDAAKDAKETAGDIAEKVKDTAGDAAEDAKDTAGDIAEKMKDTAGDIAKKVKDTAGDTAEDAKKTAYDARKDLLDTVAPTDTRHEEDPGELITVTGDPLPGDPPISGSPVMYINGIATSKEQAIAEATELSSQLGRPVEIIFNRSIMEDIEGPIEASGILSGLDARTGWDTTGDVTSGLGFLIDAVKVVANRLVPGFAGMDPLTNRVMTRIQERIAEGETDLTIVGYSGGTAHANAALKQLEELGKGDLLEHVSYYNVGSPLAEIEVSEAVKEKLKNFEEIADSHDPIVALGGKGGPADLNGVKHGLINNYAGKIREKYKDNDHESGVGSVVATSTDDDKDEPLDWSAISKKIEAESATPIEYSDTPDDDGLDCVGTRSSFPDADREVDSLFEQLETPTIRPTTVTGGDWRMPASAKDQIEALSAMSTASAAREQEALLEAFAAGDDSAADSVLQPGDVGSNSDSDDDEESLLEKLSSMLS